MGAPAGGVLALEEKGTDWTGCEVLAAELVLSSVLMTEGVGLNDTFRAPFL